MTHNREPPETGNCPRLRPSRPSTKLGNDKLGLLIPSGKPIGLAVLPTHRHCRGLSRIAPFQLFRRRLDPSRKRPLRLTGSSSAPLLAVSLSILGLSYFLPNYAAKLGLADRVSLEADLPLTCCSSSALNWAPIKTRNPVQ